MSAAPTVDHLARLLPFSRPFLAALLAMSWTAENHRTRTLETLAALPSGLRDSHIEHTAKGEDGCALVRFTWNRGGHYLDFAVLADGRFEWFYSSPEHAYEGSDDPVDVLPPRFFALLRHARTDEAREADLQLAAADAPCARCVLKSAGHANACAAGQCYVRHPRRELVAMGGETAR